MPVTIGNIVLEVEIIATAPNSATSPSSFGAAKSSASTDLIGAGRSELCQSLFGITKPLSGRLTLNGPGNPYSFTRMTAIRASTPASSMCRRNAVVTALRYRCRSIRTCRCPRSGRTSRKSGFLKAADEFALARKYTKRLDLRAAAQPGPVGTLSGGNQQKVVIAKWLATQAEGHHPRRADQGHRHRLQGRRARLHGRTRRPKVCQRHHDLLRTAGNPRHVRPRRGHARGPFRQRLFDHDRLDAETLVRDRRRQWHREGRMPACTKNRDVCSSSLPSSR